MFVNPECLLLILKKNSTCCILSESVTSCLAIQEFEHIFRSRFSFQNVQKIRSLLLGRTGRLGPPAHRVLPKNPGSGGVRVGLGVPDFLRVESVSDGESSENPTSAPTWKALEGNRPKFHGNSQGKQSCTDRNFNILGNKTVLRLI